MTRSDDQRPVAGTDFFPEPMALVAIDGSINAPNCPCAAQLSAPSDDGLVGPHLDPSAAFSARTIAEYLQACIATREELGRGAVRCPCSCLKPLI